MRAFTYCCRSRAEWYSEFSRRSPICRARWISFGRSTRYSLSRPFNSFWSLPIASSSTVALLVWFLKGCAKRVTPVFSGCQNRATGTAGGGGGFRPPRHGLILGRRGRHKGGPGPPPSPRQERPVQGGHRWPKVLREHISIDLGGDGRRGVPEDLLHLVDRHPGLDHPRSRAFTQSLERDSPDPGPTHSPPGSLGDALPRGIG